MRKRIVSTVVVVLAVCVLLGYFFVWRPSNADYSVALGQVYSLQQNSETIDQIVKNISTPYNAINPGTIASLQVATIKYSQAYDELTKLPAINRDFNLSSAYTKHEPALLSYKKSAENLVVSVVDFSTLVKTCGDLQAQLKIIVSNTAFDVSAKDCVGAIKNAKSSPDTMFNSQLLNDYQTRAINVINSYQQLIAARTSNTSAQKKAIDTANSATSRLEAMRTTKLNLSLTPNPASDIQSIVGVINSQQKMFFR